MNIKVLFITLSTVVKIFRDLGAAEGKKNVAEIL
jgi:hypothetical protein